MILKILHHPHPILRLKAEPVESVTGELMELATAMIQTMYTHQGLGLAAPQVGRSVRLIVVMSPTRTDPPIIVFNPVISNRNSSLAAYKEGCLSIPGHYDFVQRSTALTVTGLNLFGESVTHDLTGLQAAIFQHEIDHLDGIEFIDHLLQGPRILALKKTAANRINTK